MNLNTLPTQDQFRGSTSDESQEKTAAGIAQFLLLEECVARCEALAESLSVNGTPHPLMDKLSQGTAACDRYLSAKARESRHENRLGAKCADALAAIATACRELKGETAIRCRQTCQVCQVILSRGLDVPAELCC